MKILITICARGGSKGIPGKNIKVMNGKPLIVYSIAIAQLFQSRHVGTHIALSTDSEEIKEIASAYGIKTDYLRPEYLANDTCGKVDAIIDIVKYTEQKNNCRYDYVLDLDCTSPLRTIDDLEGALDLMEKDRNALSLFSVSEPGRNPYFNQVEKKANGYYGIVKEAPDGLVWSRQTAPVVYDQNASFYFYTKKFFDEGIRSSDTERSIAYLVNHTCFDLDNPIDFEFMEFLLKNNKLDFQL